MKIPKTFKLFSHTFEVRRASCAELEEMAGGPCYAFVAPDRLLIYVANDKALASTYKVQSFVHELVHCLLNLSSKPELSEDEIFVDGLAELLLQALNSMEPSQYD